MSGWRSRLASVRPRRRDGEVLPALAAIVLIVAVVAQFAMPVRTEFPDVVGIALRRAPPTPASVVGTYPLLLSRSIFAPSRATGAAAAGETAPVGFNGFSLVGIVVVRNAARVVVRSGDGTSRRLRPGQEIAGWRLAGADRQRAIFIRGGERRVLTVGGSTASVAAMAPAAIDRGGLPVLTEEDDR